MLPLGLTVHQASDIISEQRHISYFILNFQFPRYWFRTKTYLLCYFKLSISKILVHDKDISPILF